MITTIYEGLKDTVFLGGTGELRITLFKYDGWLHELAGYAVSFEEPKECMVVFSDDRHVGFRSGSGGTIVQLPLGADEVALIEDLGFIDPELADDQGVEFLIVRRENGYPVFYSEIPGDLSDRLFEEAEKAAQASI